jgi:serine/threonine-protein kinase RsbW
LAAGPEIPEPPPVPPEENAEELYEHAPCGYLSTLPDGTICRVNRTFLAWTGHTREELVGARRFQDLLTAGGRIYHETHYAPLLRMQGTVREIALDVVRADGRRLPVLVNSVLTTDDDGAPRLVRTTVFNATDRRRYERELLRAREDERAARERIERLQRMTALLASAVDAAAIGRAVVDELMAIAGADRALFALADTEAGELDVICAPGWGDGAQEAWRRRWVDAGTAVASAVGAGEPAFLERIGDERAAPPGLPEPASLAVLPLVGADRVRGVVALGFASERAFEEYERAFLEACATQCAQALERARLHEETAQAARRTAFIAETSRALDEAQGVAARAARLADRIVPELADWVRIETVAVEGAEAELLAERGALPARLAGAAGEAILRALGGGRPALARGGGAAAWVALPLRARGRITGAIALGSSGGERRLRAGDLPFLGDLADRAGLALENARLLEREREVAHVLQRSLLAGDPPSDARFAVAARYEPAIEGLEVGGDWHDAFALDSNRLAIVVGDVVGRGVVAASAMGQLRSAVRALAGTGAGPGQVLKGLDTFARQVEAAQLATVAYAELSLDTDVLRFACAGHPPPVLVEPGGEPRLLWDGRSAPIGTPFRMPRSQGDVLLRPGARLLLYTDGLVERRDESIDAGLDRLVREVAARDDVPIGALVGELIEALRVEVAVADDVCVLCVERLGDRAAASAAPRIAR